MKKITLCLTIGLAYTCAYGMENNSMSIASTIQQSSNSSDFDKFLCNLDFNNQKETIEKIFTINPSKDFISLCKSLEKIEFFSGSQSYSSTISTDDSAALETDNTDNSKIKSLKQTAIEKLSVKIAYTYNNNTEKENLDNIQCILNTAFSLLNSKNNIKVYFIWRIFKELCILKKDITPLELLISLKSNLPTITPEISQYSLTLHSNVKNILTLYHYFSLMAEVLRKKKISSQADKYYLNLKTHFPNLVYQPTEQEMEKIKNEIKNEKLVRHSHHAVSELQRSGFLS